MKNAALTLLTAALLAGVSSSEGLMAYVQRRIKKESCPRARELVQECCTEVEDGFISKWVFDICFPQAKGGSMMYKYRDSGPIPDISAARGEGPIPAFIEVGKLYFESNDCSGPIDESIRVESWVNTNTCNANYKFDLVELSEENVAGLYAVVGVPQPQNSDLCSTSSNLAAWLQTAESLDVSTALIGSGTFCLEGEENRTGFDGNGNILVYPEDNCQGTPASVTCLASADQASVWYGAKLSAYKAAFEAHLGHPMGKQTYGLAVFKQYAEQSCETEIGFGGSILYGFCIPSGDGVKSTQRFYLGETGPIPVRRLEDGAAEEFFDFYVQALTFDNKNCQGLPSQIRAEYKSSSCTKGTRSVPKPIELDNLSPELDTFGVALQPYMNATYWTPTVCQDKYVSASLTSFFGMPEVLALRDFTFFSSGTCVNQGRGSFLTSANGNMTYFSDVNCTGTVNQVLGGVCNTEAYNEDWKPIYYTAAPDYEMHLGRSLREFAHFLAPQVFSERLATQAPTTTPATTDPDPKTSSPTSAALHVVSVGIFLTTMVLAVVL